MTSRCRVPYVILDSFQTERTDYSMDYEIVNLEKKTAVGIQARTSNLSPDMGAVIGGLWQRFFGEGLFFAVPEKANAKSIGLYSNYSDDMNEYDVTVCCEVDHAETVADGLTVAEIPAGKYAKFVVQGNMVTAVHDFWTQLHKIDLPRAYTADFEEYQNTDENNAVIHIYISLKNES